MQPIPRATPANVDTVRFRKNSSALLRFEGSSSSSAAAAAVVVVPRGDSAARAARREDALLLEVMMMVMLVVGPVLVDPSMLVEGGVKLAAEEATSIRQELRKLGCFA